jgi:hypothetical protein
MKPIILEVISLVPSLFAGCTHCEYVTDQVGLKDKRDNQDLNEYPEDLKEDYLFLSGWVKELSQRYREKILIKITDAQSLQGFFKSIRYRAFRYPAFIINGRKKYTGKDKARLQSLLQEELGNA